MKNLLFVIIIIVCQGVGWGQPMEKVLDPPSADFISLSLQTHKGKLRFGVQDEYFVKADGTYISSREEGYFEMDKRSSHHMASKHAFMELLKMRFKEDMFAVMDKDLFTERKQNMYEEELKSLTAQQHVLALANALCNTQQLIRFFCNPKEEDCVPGFPQEGYYNEPRNQRPWGGRGASEFQKLRAYTAFVGEKFPMVEKWGKSLYPDDILEGYYVARTNLGTYDFKEGGYWFNTHQFYNRGFLLHWYGLQPSNSAERNLMHPNGTSILFKMPPEEAEHFSEKHQYLYLVLDVTGYLNGVENYRADQLKTTFSLNSPIIELYSDDGLTQKVGEIDINTMVFKTR